MEIASEDSSIIMPAERKKSLADDEIPLLIQDYNRRAENMWKEFLERGNEFDRMVDTRIAVELSKMDDEFKNTTIGELMAAQKQAQMEEPVDEKDGSNIFDDSVFGKFQNLRGTGQVLGSSKIKTTVKKSSRKPAARMQRETPATVRQSSRKQGRTASNSSTDGDLTSTVKKGAATNLLSVPCTPINPVGAGPLGVGMTPIYTKFNMSTPLPRMAARDPKQNEITVSLNGSPVRTVMKAPGGRGRGKNAEPAMPTDSLHIGGTQFSLQLPVAADIDIAGFELEEAHYEKLSIISQGINKLLEMRAASSTDSE